DVRFHARQPLGELPERKRVAGQTQLAERGELRDRQADVGEPRLHARLEHARGVQHGEQSGAFGASHPVTSCILYRLAGATDTAGPVSRTVFDRAGDSSGLVWSAAVVACRWTRSALPVSSEPCAFQIPNSEFQIK